MGWLTGNRGLHEGRAVPVLSQGEHVQLVFGGGHQAREGDLRLVWKAE